MNAKVSGQILLEALTLPQMDGILLWFSALLNQRPGLNTYQCHALRKVWQGVHTEHCRAGGGLVCSRSRRSAPGWSECPSAPARPRWPADTGFSHPRYRAQTRAQVQPQDVHKPCLVCTVPWRQAAAAMQCNECSMHTWSLVVPVSPRPNTLTPTLTCSHKISGSQSRESRESRDPTHDIL